MYVFDQQILAVSIRVSASSSLKDISFMLVKTGISLLSLLNVPSWYKKMVQEEVLSFVPSWSWDKLWIVVRGTLLLVYKDSKSAKAAPEVYYKGEAPTDLRGGTAEIATNYTKKKHVFRVKLSNGAEYLFQAKDDDEMGQWVNVLTSVCKMQGSGGPSRSHTLPAPQERKDEPKRRSFFTLKKN
ncbi:spectrin beta chain-like [Lycorma delicatula]|uniref:spectrin beta chain-like n=1 Tax=Lycorma delicatula TaxID=130591 RepID=UPI003F50FF8E